METAGLAPRREAGLLSLKMAAVQDEEGGWQDQVGGQRGQLEGGGASVLPKMKHQEETFVALFGFSKRGSPNQIMNQTTI